MAIQIWNGKERWLLAFPALDETNGRDVLDDVETIAAYSQDMSEFLKDSQRPSAGPSSRPS